MDLRPLFTLKCDLEPNVHPKEKYVHSSEKYVHFLGVNQDPIRPYLSLNILLGNLRNGFNIFLHPKMRFGTSCTTFRKIHTFFTKIRIFFVRPIRTLLGPIILKYSFRERWEWI